MRCERDVGEPQPRTEGESPEAGQTLMSSPAVLHHLYQSPQAAASRLQGQTAQRYVGIGLSEQCQMRLWELGAR